MIKINGFDASKTKKSWKINNKNIEVYKKYFSKILISNIVDNDSREEIKKICEFIGINIEELNLNVDKHKSKEHSLPGYVKRRRKIYFRLTKPIRLLIKFF